MTTNISWTDETINPIVGCSRISEGCQKCYAATAAKSPRLQQFPQYQSVSNWDGTVEFVKSQLIKPLHWRKPKKIFVCSMADLFHANVPDEWIHQVMTVGEQRDFVRC
jgi:protein gp37